MLTMSPFKHKKSLFFTCGLFKEQAFYTFLLVPVIHIHRLALRLPFYTVTEKCQGEFENNKLT